MRRISWQLLVGTLLLLLIAVLATLQYRWLGQVSDAERERMRASMRTRAANFSQDFDREVSRAYRSFSLDSSVFERDPAGALSEAYARERVQSVVGGIVRSVYVLRRRGEAVRSLKRLDPKGRTLAVADWPMAFDKLRGRLERELVVVRGVGAPQLVVIPGAIDPVALALIVPVIQMPPASDAVSAVPAAPRPAPTIVLELDEDRLKHTLIELLVRTHFGPIETSDYLVTVVSRDEPSQVIYASAPDAVVTPRTADVALGVFSLRLTAARELAAADSTSAKGAVRERQSSVAIMFRRLTARHGEPLTSAADEPGTWQVLVRGRQGSLEAVVAQSRRRNLAISLGVLGLLAASFVLVIGSARRQQSLVRQQMEFVAAVSHELRTPLAAMCSAGDNLADGLVTDHAEIREYGSLIRKQGRRLSDTVERVMAFSGISSGVPLRMRPGVDVARLIREAVGGTAVDDADQRVAVHVRLNGALPPVTADPDALGGALRNIVDNAIKYSRNGGAVDVEAHAVGADIQIAVTDRGLGIDEADLPHVFKPFYRGRRAVDAQVRGTGVGLSIVQRVIQAHRGAVQVRSRAGEGTTVTITLPAASADNAGQAEARVGS